MQRDRPDILFIPPLGFAAALLAAILLGVWFPLGLLPAFPWWPGLLAGAALVALSLYTNVSGFLAFRRAGTNVIPTKPALTVVRDGPFRYTRNPMYLGMIGLVLGIGLLFSNLWGAILALVLWLALDRGVVRREERYMEAKFGDSYRALLAATRRWL
jgi:protein-S-isoprenylcysteine O-methyltransferase Ste14